jgi:hypothetical protein
VQFAKIASRFKHANTRILEVLKPDSEVLERIQSDFHRIIRGRAEKGERRIEITCFFEELRLPGIGEARASTELLL